jgi:hypothetical protein
MEKQTEKHRTSGGDLFPITMVNALAWAIAIIVSLIMLRDTGYCIRLFPVLGGGACVASVVVSVTWRRRRQDKISVGRKEKP